MDITPTSLKITQLLGSTNERYVIPAYQRRYSWTEKQLYEFLDDISLIEGAGTHLLGTIVCLTGNHVAGLNNLELVDGQQRLTTVSILLHCIRARLVRENEVDQAKEIERLLEARALGSKAVSKISLDSLDAAEYEGHLRSTPPSNCKNHCLSQAFKLFRDWVDEQKLEDLGTFLYHLMNQAIVIRLDVGQAKDAFKLFETINNRGLRLSPADIVKNFLLGNAARFDETLLDEAKARWADLISHLDGVKSETFFRYFLCSKQRRRITASYVIMTFKSLFMKHVAEASTLPERHYYFSDEDVGWNDDDEEDAADPADPLSEDGELEGDVPAKDKNGVRIPFAAFMSDLAKCARTYGEIVRCETGHPQIDRSLRNLRMIKAVQTYGFLMYLRVNGCADGDFLAILQMTEAFMLRRHICRLRSNENETLFARLCGVDCANAVKAVTKAYRDYSPSDERFVEDFAGVTFTTGLMDRARYCLEQIELYHHGDHQELSVLGSSEVHIEHIIPQKIKTKKARQEYGDWIEYLGNNAVSQHPKFVTRLGNLTLLAKPLNITASNNPYERKVKSYAESAIKITQSLPQDYPQFKFFQVQKRSEQFASLATEIWPIP